LEFEKAARRVESGQQASFRDRVCGLDGSESWA